MASPRSCDVKITFATRHLAKRRCRKCGSIHGTKRSYYTEPLPSRDMINYDCRKTFVRCMKNRLTKVWISNLNPEWTEDTLRELFSPFGEIKEITLHCDIIGRSDCTAIVNFAKNEDAVATMAACRHREIRGSFLGFNLVKSNLPRRRWQPV